MNRFEIHAHSIFSNIRLLDSINKIEALIDRAIELGLSGISLTDHDCLSGAIKANKYAQEIKDKYPNFKIALGNEIYLCSDRRNGQRYYHFILIAKNKIGFRALRELSSRAWLNSYYDRGLERVVTTYSDLEEIVKKYPNSLIATTACLGGQYSIDILDMLKAGQIGDLKEYDQKRIDLEAFLSYCLTLFGEDFYIECAPGKSSDQIKANKASKEIADRHNIKMVIGTDAHFLKKEDRYAHESYLNSKGGEREVASFYEYAYLQSEEEIIENLIPSGLNYNELVINSYSIYEKIENYSLKRNPVVPRVKVEEYPKLRGDCSFFNSYPVIKELLKSDNLQERYWINECYNSLIKKEDIGEIDKGKHEVYMNQLETEADIIKTVGEKLNECVFSYFNTFQHYIDLFWECGSIVGPGRGSSCGFLSNWLMGLTQLDPIQWKLYHWRFMNKERIDELPDIDIDLAPSKRPLILNKIKEERKANFLEGLDELSYNNLGCTLIATFGTESTKSVILTSARGYRSEDYPNGIDNDTAQYLAALIPQERGFLWTLDEVINGNSDKGRKPVKSFIKEVNNYPRLLEIMTEIEGLVNKRSSHASGVLMLNEDPYEFCCFMKTPKGEVITQWDLHDLEWAGGLKFDFLVTEITDKLTICLELLQKKKVIEKATLRESYNKYLNPQKIDITKQEIWDGLAEGKVLDCFQFSTDAGLSAAKKLKPQNPEEMTQANALMRLMAPDKEAENPIDKYKRFKEHFPELWEKEMENYHVTKDEKAKIEHIYAPSYGCPSIQEDLMVLLMECADFSLAEANEARSIVGKKKMSKIPGLRKMIWDRIEHKDFAQYIWDTGIKPQLGYAFNRSHSLPYSFVGIQTLVLATQFNPVFWNTACLIVNSGGIEQERIDEDKKRDKATDYGKIAKAIGEILARNIKVSLVDINKSDFTFDPDPDNNQILFGMKALSRINKDTIEKIIAGRPYFSFKDFLNRCPLPKTAVLSLIKAGAFDNLEATLAAEFNLDPRMFIMIYYLSIASEPKKKLNLQNFNALLEKNLFPSDHNEEFETVKNIYHFNKYLKNLKYGEYYVFDEVSERFYNKHFSPDYLEVMGNKVAILQKTWKKQYDNIMNIARDWLNKNQETVLKEFNDSLFMEAWNKYAEGNISSWEMESMCFYYHKHELAHVNNIKYGIVNFNSLPTTPMIDKYYKRNGREIPLYKLTRIAGTVISKNDTKSSISLLTTTGVVNVKFNKEYYAMYQRQLSEIQRDGKKKITEKGWFTRGNKILVYGFRRDDTFVAKRYKNSPSHQLYKITKVSDNGDITLVHDRGV